MIANVKITHSNNLLPEILSANFEQAQPDAFLDYNDYLLHQKNYIQQIEREIALTSYEYRSIDIPYCIVVKLCKHIKMI